MSKKKSLVTTKLAAELRLKQPVDERGRARYRLYNGILARKAGFPAQIHTTFAIDLPD
jgi:hypothetical protein